MYPCAKMMKRPIGKIFTQEFKYGKSPTQEIEYFRNRIYSALGIPIKAIPENKSSGVTVDDIVIIDESSLSKAINSEASKKLAVS